MRVNDNRSVSLNLKTNAIIKVYNKISKCKIHNNVTSGSIFFAFNLLTTFTCSFQIFLLNANFFVVVSGEHWGKSTGSVQPNSQINEHKLDKSRAISSEIFLTFTVIAFTIFRFINR